MLERYQEHYPSIDEEAFVHDRSVVIGNVSVGAQSTIWPNVTIRGDDGPVVIGARTSIQDGAVIHATENLSKTTVGDQVTVGHNAILHGCVIGNNTIVGMGSTILDNAVIGENCIIGANSLVTMNVQIPPNSMVLGSPARAVRPLKDEELKWIEYSWKRYVEQCHIYRAMAQGADDA
jgi:carbonic anhydrase/acetyltransferase-like protein (isoleucine patch superfamily)